jgi:phage terminase large subunit-like protein
LTILNRSASATTEARARGKTVLGRTEPRLWTRPLRDLRDPANTHGYSVIDFALTFLGIRLYEWQKWLLIHALELNPDGTYRFRRVVVMVGRQNGKSTVMIVLALWWLHVDAKLQEQHIDPRDFLVLGVAQSLDVAEGFLAKTTAYMNPEDEQAIPALAKHSRKPVLGTGKHSVSTKSGCMYTVRAANRKAGRGKSASRIIMDEVREQQNWDAWAAISKTMNNTWNPQLWAISNAGDARSVVLMAIREALVKEVETYDEMVAAGIQSLEDWANHHDMTQAIFEWSAPDGCELDDPDAIAQANPALGHGHMTWDVIMSDLNGGEPEHVYRTEVLCQWVTARVMTWLDPVEWSELVDEDSEPAPGSHLFLGLDTSQGKAGMTYLAVAAERLDGNAHVELIAQRAGMLWVVDAVVDAMERWGMESVAIQARGAPASEFIAGLKAKGVEVYEVGGTGLGGSALSIRNRVHEGRLRHRDQPALNVPVSGGTARRVTEQWLWDRIGSPVDIAPIVAVTNALYAMEQANYTQRSAYEEHGLVVV